MVIYKKFTFDSTTISVNARIEIKSKEDVNVSGYKVIGITRFDTGGYRCPISAVKITDKVILVIDNLNSDTASISSSYIGVTVAYAKQY